MSADNESWKITAFASRDAVQTALLAHEDAVEWDPSIVIAGSEVAEDRPDDWQLEAWLPRRPKPADKDALRALFSTGAPSFAIEHLPPTDWVTLSQQGVEPIREGPFHVHTPDFAPLARAGVRDLLIPASRAFGTGQHATTAGCLAMLAVASARGHKCSAANASDIDPVCAPVVIDNAELNDVPLGAGPGALTMVIAAGLGHRLLAARGPYDLLIANILAGPLVELAPEFGAAVAPGGSLLLAGLLTMQESAVRRACTRAGFRLAGRIVRGDWSILWLRRRRGVR